MAGNDGSDNDDYGFVVVDANLNSFTANRAYGNGVNDASQDATSTDNTWMNNCFGTTENIPTQPACST